MAESPAIRAAKDSYALTAGPSGATRDTTRTTRWLEIRRTTVAVKTWQTDRELLRLVPTSLQALQVSAVSGREVARSFESLLSRGLGHTSVVRYRASLSVFFAWCVREKLIATNPVTAVRVPKSSAPPVELHPFTEDELEAVYDAWALRDPRLADVMLVLGWTGLRWAEARELRVGDFVEVPSPALLVRRSAPEGVGVKATKSGRSRRVPVANRVLPIIKRFTLGKGPDDLLLTTYMGAQLHRNAVARTLDWKTTAQGRRIHDLRHTAACLWLARGVDPGTVQAWMGHESIATTNRYLHHLGTGADIAGLARLNEDRGSARGGAITQKSKEPRMTGIVLPSQRGFLLVEHRGFEPLTFSLRKPPGHGFAPFGGGSTPAESCTDAVDFRSGVRRGPARTNLFDFQSGAVHAGENSARESAVGMDRGGVSSTDETQGLVESVGRGRGALPYPERELAIPGGSALSDGMKDKGAANPVPLGAGIDEQVDDERAFELGVPDGALDDQDGTDHATLMGRHGRGIETESAVLPREGVPDLLGSLGERVARDARRVGVEVGGGEFVSKRGVERLQLDLGIGCWREASEVKGHEV